VNSAHAVSSVNSVTINSLLVSKRPFDLVRQDLASKGCQIGIIYLQSQRATIGEFFGKNGWHVTRAA